MVDSESDCWYDSGRNQAVAESRGRMSLVEQPKPGYRKPGQKAIIAMSMTAGYFTHPDDIEVILGGVKSKHDDKWLELNPSLMHLMPENATDVADAKVLAHKIVDEFFTHLQEGRDFGMSAINVVTEELDKPTEVKP